MGVKCGYKLRYPSKTATNTVKKWLAPVFSVMYYLCNCAEWNRWLWCKRSLPAASKGHMQHGAGSWQPRTRHLARLSPSGRDTDTLLGSLTEHQPTNRSTAQLLSHGNLQPLTFIICQGAHGFTSPVSMIRSTAETRLDHTDGSRVAGRGFIIQL